MLHDSIGASSKFEFLKMLEKMFENIFLGFFNCFTGGCGCNFGKTWKLFVKKYTN